MAPRRSLALLAAAIFLATAGCDAGTKVLAAARLAEGESVPVVAGLLDLRLVYNEGVALSRLRHLPPAALASGALVLLAGVLWALRSHAARPAGASALALVAAGGICNAIDRLVHGAVTDMIVLHGWPGIFNVADVAIVAGAGLLLLSSEFEKETEPPRNTENTETT